MIEQKDIENIKNNLEEQDEKWFKNLEKKIKKETIRAICDFDMIKEWETILLGISWWKDSMLLWYILSEMRKSMKTNFNIKAVYIFKDFLINCDIEFEEKKKYFEEVLNIPLEKFVLSLPEDSKVKEWLWQSCQRCAYARRITMMKLCKKRWASKIAYWHHMDDIVVTTFMNMIQWKSLKIMPPINHMSHWDVAFIRPFAYIRERDILRLTVAKEIPFSWCACPVWERWKRKEIKTMVWENEKIFPKYVENIFWSLIKDFNEKYKKSWYKM